MASPDVEEPSLIERIGRIAVSSAETEYMLAELVVSLIGTARAVNVVFGQGWGQNKAAAVALIKERIAELSDNADDRRHVVPSYEGMLKTIASADALIAQRGNVVHSLWSSRSFDEHSSVTFKRWGKRHDQSWTPAKLHELYINLRAATFALAQAVEFVVGERTG